MTVFTKKVVIAIIAMFSSFLSFAQEFEVNGLTFYYSSEEQAVYVKFKGSVPNGNSYSGDIVIPANVEYEGQNYPVVGVSSYTFYKCPNLTSVSLPESIKAIGEYAFYECSSLTSIEIPDAVAYLGRETFRECI